MRLNDAPPGGVIFNAWNTDALVSGQSIVGIHHPHGDFKKVSSGVVGSPAARNIQDIDTGQKLYNLWSVTFDSSTTEPGSSGSGLFYCTNSQCDLRGGLFGGPAGPGQECQNRRNSYSRFDVAYSGIAGYLTGSTPTPVPASPPTTTLPGATFSNGALTIRRLEIDAGALGKIYYDVTMRLQAGSNPLTLTVETAVPSN